MIVTYEKLKKEFGGSSGADVAVRLKNSGVKYFLGKQNRPFTTIEALNVALGIQQSINLVGEAHEVKNEITL